MKCDLKDVRIGRKKLLLPASYIRKIGNLSQVMTVLKIHSHKKAFNFIAMAVQSARQNLISFLSKNGEELKESDYDVDVQIGRGAKSMKRFMARAKGSADKITKPTSHIFVKLTKRCVNGK